MIERTPILNAVTHVILLSGVVLAVLPLWLVFVASTLTLAEVNAVPMPMLPGGSLWNNVTEAWARAGLRKRGKTVGGRALFSCRDSARPSLYVMCHRHRPFPR